MLAADAVPPVVPNRFREPIYHVIDDAVDGRVAEELGQWLYFNRDKLNRVGDDAGEYLFAFEMPSKALDDAPGLSDVRKRLAGIATDKDVLTKLCVPEFDPSVAEIAADLVHHRGHRAWTHDAVTLDGEVAATRRIAFALHLHSDPRMFTGGDIEFGDGTTVEHKANRLVLWHPCQTYRVRRVECWSAHVLDGRWSVFGWIHGPSPAGWADRVREIMDA